MKKILVFSLLIMSGLILQSMTSAEMDMVIITKKQFTKTIEESFPISKDGVVAIANKYGNIDMHTWDKNEVKFKVNIIVNATSESVAKDVFERIEVSFNNSNSRVEAVTEIESKKRLLVELVKKP